MEQAKSATKRVVLLRHGESTWNKKNRFTGWVDVGLTEAGIQEAKAAAKLLVQERLVFDIACTSVLKRAIKTLWIVLEKMDLMWIPVDKNWRLNERHYGALQGLNKAETATRYGEKQVHAWRRSYDVLPPKSEAGGDHDPARDPRYRQVPFREIPLGESLQATIDRLLPYWHQKIAPAVRRGEQVLVVAHGNSLRGLVKYLDNVPDERISELNIPTGVPLVYELDEGLKPLRSFYLEGDPDKSTESDARVLR